MENISSNEQQDNDLPDKKSLRTLTFSKTIDVILGFLGSVGIGVSPLPLGDDSGGGFIIAGFIVILALIFTKTFGFKYLFYGILVTVSIVGIVFGGCVLILMNLDL